MSRILLAAPLVLLALVAVSGTAWAHTSVDVDDTYRFVVGFRNEPPYAGLKNGLDLGVNRIVGDGTEPISGLLGNLTVTYEIAGRTFSPPDWRGQHGRPGWYTAEITPTREGQYTVRIVGDIEGHPIDVRVLPHEVLSARSTMFPEPDLTAEEATTKIAALERQVAELRAEISALKASTNSATPPTPTTASNTPAAGALAALAVVGAAALALRARK